jgi:hypothetical protein
MYWALVVFNFFVALSAVAMILGNTAENDSGTVVLVCATVIASVALVMLVVSVGLLYNSRKAKNEPQGGQIVDNR